MLAQNYIWTFYNTEVNKQEHGRVSKRVIYGMYGNWEVVEHKRLKRGSMWDFLDVSNQLYSHSSSCTILSTGLYAKPTERSHWWSILLELPSQAEPNTHGVKSSQAEWGFSPQIPELQCRIYIHSHGWCKIWGRINKRRWSCSLESKN